MEAEFEKRIKKLLDLYTESDHRFHTLLMVASGTDLALKLYKVTKRLPLPFRYQNYLNKMWDINKHIVESLSQTIDHHLKGANILPLSGFHGEFIASLDLSDHSQSFEAFLNWEQYDLIQKKFNKASQNLTGVEKFLLTKPFIMKLNFYPWYYFQSSLSFDNPQSRIKNSLKGYKIADEMGWANVFQQLNTV